MKSTFALKGNLAFPPGRFPDGATLAPSRLGSRPSHLNHVYVDPRLFDSDVRGLCEVPEPESQL